MKGKRAGKDWNNSIETNKYDLENILKSSDFASFMNESSPMARLTLVGCYSEFLMFKRLLAYEGIEKVHSPGDPMSAMNQHRTDIGKGITMIPDFYYEYKGKMISHEHKTIKTKTSNAPLAVLRVNYSLLTEDKIASTLPFYNVYDIVSVDLRYCDEIRYVPMFRVPLHKKYPGRHRRNLTVKVAIEVGHKELSDALDDIIENQPFIAEIEKDFKDELSFSASCSYDTTEVSSQKLDKKTGLERFFIL